MNDRARFTYLYFRLVDHVTNQPLSESLTDVRLWEEDQTMLSFLAHRCFVSYAELCAMPVPKKPAQCSAGKNGHGVRTA